MKNVKNSIILGGSNMRITFESVGDFEETTKWLKEASKKSPIESARDIAAKGVEALSRATPIGDTGETAGGWVGEVTTDSIGTDISFVNVAHPEASVNVAKIIETGHATGNGGYVPPRPYIRQAMDSVFEEGVEKIVKEMTE